MSVIFTVGYEGSDIDSFVATLKAAGIKRLADVRAVPISRKKGFSKRKLSDRLESEGIEYFPFSSLGDPKPGREAARAGLFERFRSIYSKHLDSEVARLAISDLSVVANEQPTCLLCFERDPTHCHRSMVADQLTGFEAFHLYADDPDRYVRHASRLPRHHSRQSAAAA